MPISDNHAGLTFVHIGDLHITSEQERNYQDFLDIIESINCHLTDHIDFCVLPGDNANEGSAAQYALIRRALCGLRSPVHVIPGDHDRVGGDLSAFYQGLNISSLPNAVSTGGYRCLFLDVVSPGSGGPDFAIGSHQLQWLISELQAAAAHGLSAVVFMHAYPADLKHDGDSLRQLLHEYKVAFVDMGHTHYNELTNDGITIYATTRSTGQIEEGPVGFSIVSLNDDIVSWRFKPLRTPWPYVMITSPSDYRLLADHQTSSRSVAGQLVVSANVFGSSSVSACRCCIDGGPWNSMDRQVYRWTGICEAPRRQFTLTVEATDRLGNTDTDTIVVAAPGYSSPPHAADGSDADALGAWPERHLLGTRLGPNRNGRQW